MTDNSHIIGVFMTIMPSDYIIAGEYYNKLDV
jgi:hypothetical protein